MRWITGFESNWATVFLRFDTAVETGAGESARSSSVDLECHYKRDRRQVQVAVFLKLLYTMDIAPWRLRRVASGKSREKRILTLLIDQVTGDQWKEENIVEILLRLTTRTMSPIRLSMNDLSLVVLALFWISVSMVVVWVMSIA